jgi:hypothetical protein
MVQVPLARIRTGESPPQERASDSNDRAARTARGRGISAERRGGKILAPSFVPASFRASGGTNLARRCSSRHEAKSFQGRPRWRRCRCRKVRASMRARASDACTSIPRCARRSQHCCGGSTSSCAAKESLRALRTSSTGLDPPEPRGLTARDAGDRCGRLRRVWPILHSSSGECRVDCLSRRSLLGSLRVASANRAPMKEQMFCPRGCHANRRTHS